MRKNPEHLAKNDWIALLAIALVMHLVIWQRVGLVGWFTDASIGYAVLGGLFLALCGCALLPGEWRGWVFSPLTRGLALLNGGSGGIRARRCGILLGWLGTMVLGIGLILRYRVYAPVPIDPYLADMLPLIEMACDTLLRGESPYRMYDMPWTLPLTFMPGMWIPYLPARWVGIDLRHAGLAMTAAIGSVYLLLLLRPLRERANGSTEPSTRVSIAAFLALLFFMFSPSIILFGAHGHTNPFWLYITLFCFCILLNRPLLSAICIGMLLCTRQTSVIYVPAVAIFWLRTQGAHRAIGLAAIAGAVAGAACLPFILGSGFSQFALAPLRHYGWLAEWDFTRGAESFAARSIGFSYLIRLHWSAEILSVFRHAMLGIAVALAMCLVRGKATLFAVMGASSMLFMLFAPIPWHYTYYPTLLLFSFAAIAAAEEASHPAARE